MKINEVQKATTISKETIRYYREQQIIHPHQNPNNHYFDYDINDVSALLHTQKYKTFHHGSLTGLPHLSTDPRQLYQQELDSIKSTLDSIDTTIEQLQQLKITFERMIQYRTSVFPNMDTIEQVSDVDGLLYLPWSRFSSNTAVISKLLASPIVYQGLVIPLSQWLDPDLQQYQPTFALGLTEHNYHASPVFKSMDFQDFISIPKHQMALRWIITLPQLSSLSVSLFQPLHDYAKHNHLRFSEDITSIILNVSTVPDYQFTILFRCIVNED